MSSSQAKTTHKCRAAPSAPLVEFLGDLLTALHLQAKETERLVAHLEQHTRPLVPTSQLPLVVTELSALRIRLDKIRTDCSEREAHHAEDLRGQRIPLKDMDPLC